MGERTGNTVTRVSKEGNRALVSHSESEGTSKRDKSKRERERGDEEKSRERNTKNVAGEWRTKTDDGGGRPTNQTKRDLVTNTQGSS